MMDSTVPSHSLQTVKFALLPTYKGMYDMIECDEPKGKPQARYI